MEQLLKRNEIEILLNTFKAHPILSICYKLFTPRMAMLNGLQVTQVDVFRETAMLLDYLLAKRDIGQEQVDSLWNKLLLDIRTWKNDATEHDKWMVASTVFQIVRAMLTQHTESCFCETVCEMLDKTTERNKKGCDEEEYKEFRHKLIEHSRVMSEWMIGYEEADEWLSDKIEHYIEEARREPDEKKKRGRKPKKIAKSEKQHGLEYPVFAKGQGVTDAHIKALYMLLTTRVGLALRQTRLTSNGFFLARATIVR